MKVLKERIEEIMTLIAEVANGNFGHQLKVSETGDELDAVIEGINMLGQELERSTVSRDFMQSIYQGVVDMLLVLNNDFTIRNVNEALVEATGYQEEELVGLPFATLFQEQDAVRVKQVIGKFQEKGKVLNVELWIATKDNYRIPASCSLSFLKNKGTEQSGVLIIAQDITELKQKERELQEAKEKAEAANEAKSNFLSSMSHEIRTPLNGILGFTNLLIDTPLNDVQKQYVSLIKTSGGNLSKLLNDILDLHRVEQDRIEIESIPFDIREALASHLEPYKQLAKSKGLSFSYTFEEGIPRLVLGDPTRISQVLINLVSNAIKFTDSGSITMHAELDPSYVGDEYSALKFSVTDTGLGIPAEKQDLIFESFTQSDQFITRKYGGFGLGLSISKKLVNLMHGKMGVVSPPPGAETGAVFWFTLKLGHATEAEVPEDGEGDVNFSFNSDSRVLVVDDNPINVFLMQDVLENFGAQVTTAESGAEAVALALESPFDLILMDIQMPEMDGLEATGKLRRANVACPIIAFSASAYKDDIARSLQAGMNDHLCKPFTNQELVAILKKWVS